MTTFPVPLGEELFAEDYESTWYCPRHQCACCDALQLHAEPRFEKYVCTSCEDLWNCVFCFTTTLNQHFTHKHITRLSPFLAPSILPSLLSSYLAPLLLLCLQRIASSSMSVGCINPTSAYTNPHSADAAASTPGQGLTRHYPVLERCVMSCSPIHAPLSCYTKTTIISIITISVLLRLYPISSSLLPPSHPIDFHNTLIHTSADTDSHKQY